MSDARTHRIICSVCSGTGTVWAPKMAVKVGTVETFSLMAPANCRDCRGAGGWQMTECPQGEQLDPE